MRKILATIVLSLFASAASAQAVSPTFFPPLPGSTMTGPLLLPDGSATAGNLSLSFTNDTDNGFFYSGGEMYYANNTARIGFSQTQMRLNSTHGFGWSATTPGSALDVSLFRDAANTLALRNGTNAQTFNIYNTYTDASNYERGFSRFTSNVFQIGTEAAGTGSPRIIAFYLNGGNRWFIHPTTYTFYPAGDGTQAIGGPTYKVKEFYLSESIQGSKNKVLTDAAAAVAIVRIAVPTNGFAAGKIIYTATSTDGTNILVTQNECQFAAADTAGTVTAGTPTCLTPSTAYKRANTLVCTITGAVSTTNYDIMATCTDNLAGTQTMSINYRLDMPQPNTVTPQ